jgi:hypothetical protein
MARYRKTTRRQRRHPVWWPRPQGRRTIEWPVPPTGHVLTTFLLPGELSLIAPGRHSLAVAVTPAGLVQIAGRSREHVIRLAAEFFATVARDRLPFVVAAVSVIVRGLASMTSISSRSWLDTRSRRGARCRQRSWRPPP